jgi:hypothetical protein
MLPPLQHLPSAALARTVRRQPPTPRDPRQPELLLPLGDSQAEKSAIRHLNLGMISVDPKSRSA